MNNKRRLCILLVAALISFYLILTAPDSPTLRLSQARPPHCAAEITFKNLTANNYFVFVKPRHSNADVISNMFLFMGLKHSVYTALNIETPMSWYGLSSFDYDTTYLQETAEPPKLLAQEMDYQPSGLDIVFDYQYSVSNKIVVGFLRDPFDVFMSCLLRVTQYRRQLKARQSVSMMLEDNVLNYLDSIDGEENLRQNKIYISQTHCNNLLSFSLGLTNSMFQVQYNLKNNPDAPENFADLVEQRFSDFLVYDSLPQTMFLLKEKYCLSSEEDFLYLPRVPENFVGIGLGKLSEETKAKVQHFLQFDYAIYNRISKRLEKKFSKELQSHSFLSRFQKYKYKLDNFNQYCCRNTLSLKPKEVSVRAYSLTYKGENDIKCSLHNSANLLVSHLVFQIQASDLTNTVSQMIINGTEFKTFLSLISSTLDESSDDEV